MTLTTQLEYDSTFVPFPPALASYGTKFAFTFGRPNNFVTKMSLNDAVSSYNAL
jgi:hypothetical protein